MGAWAKSVQYAAKTQGSALQRGLGNWVGGMRDLGRVLVTDPGAVARNAGEGIRRTTIGAVQNPGGLYNDFNRSLQREPGELLGETLPDAIIGGVLLKGLKPATAALKSGASNIAAGLEQAGELVESAKTAYQKSWFSSEVGAVRIPGAKPNLNSNDAISNFGLYEIDVEGSLHKVGKADLNRVTQSSGLPTRLHQQVRKLEKTHGTGNVQGQVVEDLGETTTAAAKAAENTRIQRIVDQNGSVPPGNEKSFKP